MTNDATLEERVRRVITEQLGLGDEEVTSSTRLEADLGVDRYDLCELLDAFEAVFAVSISDAALSSTRVGDLVACLRRSREKQRFPARLGASA